MELEQLNEYSYQTYILINQVKNKQWQFCNEWKKINLVSYSIRYYTLTTSFHMLIAYILFNPELDPCYLFKRINASSKVQGSSAAGQSISTCRNFKTKLRHPFHLYKILRVVYLTYK